MTFERDALSELLDEMDAKLAPEAALQTQTKCMQSKEEKNTWQGHSVRNDDNGQTKKEVAKRQNQPNPSANLEKTIDVIHLLHPHLQTIVPVKRHLMKCFLEQGYRQLS
jgi:hypothetical protein